MSVVEDHIRNDRNDFNKSSLSKKEVQKKPVNQFKSWLKEAIDKKVNEPYAFNLATVSAENKPSNRILYVRDINDEGLVFYTNYLSKKGNSINENPFASCCFFWPELERQVRIEGIVSKAKSSMSDEYFASRPRKSKIGAWASIQSEVMDSDNDLLNRIDEFENKFKNEVPRPESWGGYILKPTHFEFWQGRPSRLHDRISYDFNENKDWVVSRLYP